MTEENSKQDVAIRLSALQPALTAVAMAMSKDDTRPHLAGVIVRVKGDNFTIAATNGHILAVYCGKGEEYKGVESDWKPDEFMLSYSCVTRLLKEMKWIRRSDRAMWDAQWVVFNHHKKTYTHCIGVLNMELTNEMFPPIEKVMSDRLPKAGERSTVLAIAPEYLRMSSAMFEAAAGDDPVSGMIVQSTGNSPIDPMFISAPSVPNLHVILMGVNLSEASTRPAKTSKHPDMIFRKDVSPPRED